MIVVKLFSVFLLSSIPGMAMADRRLRTQLAASGGASAPTSAPTVAPTTSAPTLAPTLPPVQSHAFRCSYQFPHEITAILYGHQLDSKDPKNGPYGHCTPTVYINGTIDLDCTGSTTWSGVSAEYIYDLTGTFTNYPVSKTLKLCQAAKDGHEYCVQVAYTGGSQHPKINGCHTTFDGKQCGPCSTNCNTGRSGSYPLTVDVNCGSFVRQGHAFDGTLFNQIRL